MHKKHAGQAGARELSNFADLRAQTKEMQIQLRTRVMPCATALEMPDIPSPELQVSCSE